MLLLLSTFFFFFLGSHALLIYERVGGKKQVKENNFSCSQLDFDNHSLFGLQGDDGSLFDIPDHNTRSRSAVQL